MPPIRRVAVFNDTRRTSHYGCEFVMEALIAQLRRRGIEPAFFWPMGRDWRGRSDVAAALRTVDGVVVNGEGSIHHSARRERAHYLTEIAGFARRTAGIPSVLINSSLHELEEGVVDNLRDFAAIYLRESGSLAALERCDVGARIVPDLTLLTVHADSGAARRGVLGTDSVREEVASALRGVCSDRGWHFSRLTHAARPCGTDFPGLSYERIRRYGKWVHAAVLGRNTRHRRDFLDYLGAHALVCTGRFHAVTLALVTGTPFLAVESNTPKISGLLEDVFGTRSRVVSVDEVRALEGPEAYAWSAVETAALARFLASARSQAASMFDHVRRVLDDGC